MDIREELQGNEDIIQVEITFEVRLLFLFNLLEFIIEPDDKAVQEAATAKDDTLFLEWGLVKLEDQIEA
jgi:hypothetical protein